MEYDDNYIPFEDEADEAPEEEVKFCPFLSIGKKKPMPCSAQCAIYAATGNCSLLKVEKE